jgi:lipopolysaccharide transport system ATP-binding protein
MGRPVIEVRDLSKQYHIAAVRSAGHDLLARSLVRSVTAPFRRAGKLLRGQATGASELDEKIWALRGVSFDVSEGEVVGIIGRNGAGKSTLLKVLSRITEPTSGYARIRGRMGTLLEVGTGFHPELTGRENVFLNGAILGMRRPEILRKFDEIVAFSEIEKFIDTPVKHYSTGMSLRLAFSVAAHLEPEILLIDEVLAVGDVSFQRKCVGKMNDVANQGRTILFVSHNMAAVSRLCERVLWVDGGRLHRSGDPGTMIREYLADGASSVGERRWEGGLSNPGVNILKVDAMRVRDSRGRVSSGLSGGEAFTVEIDYRLTAALPASRIGFIVSTPDGTAAFDAFDSDREEFASARSPGHFRSVCRVPGQLLSPGRYLLSLVAGIPDVKSLASCEGALTIEISETGMVGSHAPRGRRGVFLPNLSWDVVSHGGLASAPQAEAAGETV